MNNSAMIMQSPHRDVLEATPDTDDSKARLVEELQTRGRAAVVANSWMDAKLLYEKALTMLVGDETKKVAIFNSNLSLVHNKMGNFEAARQCAHAATQADTAYVKGWWRLGQALQSLHRSSDALEALGKAKALEPTNKALLKEYEKVERKVEEELKLMQEKQEREDMAMEEEEEVAPKTTSTTTTTTTTTTKTTTKPTTTTTTTNNSNKKNDAMDDEEKIFSKSDAVRGYKVVNGKKTSYFHNELSEEAKTLIGDIAPKKLEATTTPVGNAAAPKAPSGGGSAWNKAGTWEEKNVTKWAMESLPCQILQTTFTLPHSSPAPGALVTVSKVTKIDGHASFAMARGKKRYIYEFMVKLDWQMTGDNLECSGSLAIPDIDGTIDLGEGYDIHEFTIAAVSDPSVRPLLDRFVHRGGFHEALNESIDDWVRLFQKEYGNSDVVV
jgi:hypothetical protein